MGVGLEVGGDVGSNGCSIVIVGVTSGAVFSFVLRIWESNVGGIIIVVTGAVVDVVVSEIIGILVMMVD